MERARLGECFARPPVRYTEVWQEFLPFYGGTSLIWESQMRRTFQYLDVGQDWCGEVCRFSRSGDISITDIVLSLQCLLFAWHNNNALLVAPLWVIILVQCNAPHSGVQCPLRHLEQFWNKSKAVRLDEDGLKNTLGKLLKPIENQEYFPDYG